MSYVLTAKAEDDLIGIFIYGITEFGIEQAEKYRDEVENSLNIIAENPAIAPLRMELDPPSRVHPVGVHVIIYRQNDAGEIIILRVRGARENWISNPEY